jgi:hypothetical protein
VAIRRYKDIAVFLEKALYFLKIEPSLKIFLKNRASAFWPEIYLYLSKVLQLTNSQNHTNFNNLTFINVKLLKFVYNYKHIFKIIKIY